MTRHFLCKQEGWGYEEKETDVNIAIKLVELLMTKSCDVPVIVSGDTESQSLYSMEKQYQNLLHGNDAIIQLSQRCC